MNRLGPCFGRLTKGGFGRGFGPGPGAPFGRAASSFGVSSAFRFCPTCASSVDTAVDGPATDALRDVGAPVGDEALPLGRFASALSSRGVTRSSGTAGVIFDGGFDAGLACLICEGGLLCAAVTGAVKYAASTLSTIQISAARSIIVKKTYVDEARP